MAISKPQPKTFQAKAAEKFKNYPAPDSAFASLMRILDESQQQSLAAIPARFETGPTGVARPIGTREGAWAEGENRRKAIDLMIFHQTRDKYKARLAEMGGVDKVIEDFEKYLKSRIMELGGNPESPTAIPPHPAVLPDRLEHPGTYECVLRGLHDSRTLANQNMIYKGSTATFPVQVGTLSSKGQVALTGQTEQVNYREMLAYFWLAASDPDLKSRYPSTGAASGAGMTPTELVLAMKNFAVGVSYALREHNEPGPFGDSSNSPIPEPSCAGGWYTRMTETTVSYNTCTYLQGANIPNLALKNKVMSLMFQEFILEQYKQMTPEDKKNIQEYLMAKDLMFADDKDIDPAYKTAMDKFVSRLHNNSKALADFLEARFKKDDTLQLLSGRLNEPWFKEIAKDMLDVHIFSLMMPTKLTPTQGLVDGILSESAYVAVINGMKEMVAHQQQETGAREDIEKQFRSAVFDLSIEMEQIRQRIVDESVKVRLDPVGYIETAEKNIKALSKQAQELYQKILALQYETFKGPVLEVLSQALNSDESVRVGLRGLQNTDGSIKEEDPRVKAIVNRYVEAFLSEQTKTRLQDCKRVANVCAQLPTMGLEHSSLTAAMPRAYREQTLDYHEKDSDKESAEQWALYLIALCLGTHRGEQLPRVRSAMEELDEKLIEDLLIRINEVNDRKPGFKKEIFRYLNDQLAKPEFIVEQGDKIPLVKARLRRYEQDYDFKIEDRKPKDHVSKEEVLQYFRKNLHPDEVGPLETLTRALIFPVHDSGSSLEEQMKGHLPSALLGWQNKALELYQKKGIEGLQNFVLLTLYHNLGIDHIHTGDKEMLAELCNVYMALEPGDLDNALIKAKIRKGWLPDEDNVRKFKKPNQRIAFLSAHLSRMMMTLNQASGLFSSGNLRLMTHDSSNDVLRKKQSGAYLFRISLSQPDQIVCVKQKRTDSGGVVFKDVMLSYGVPDYATKIGTKTARLMDPESGSGPLTSVSYPYPKPPGEERRFLETMINQFIAKELSSGEYHPALAEVGAGVAMSSNYKTYDGFSGISLAASDPSSYTPYDPASQAAPNLALRAAASAALARAGVMGEESDLKQEEDKPRIEAELVLDQQRAEQQRIEEEQERREAKRIAEDKAREERGRREEAKRLEEKRIATEQRIETERKAREAEERAERQRAAEAKEREDKERALEQQRAEQRRMEEQQRIQVTQQRIEQERAQVEQRRVEEQQRIQTEQRRVEQQRREAEQRREVERKAADDKKKEERKRVIEEAMRIREMKAQKEIERRKQEAINRRNEEQQATQNRFFDSLDKGLKSYNPDKAGVLQRDTRRAEVAVLKQLLDLNQNKYDHLNIATKLAIQNRILSVLEYSLQTEKRFFEAETWFFGKRLKLGKKSDLANLVHNLRENVNESLAQLSNQNISSDSEQVKQFINNLQFTDPSKKAVNLEVNKLKEECLGDIDFDKLAKETGKRKPGM